MSVFFSAGSPGFYFEEVHGEAMPDDAIEISETLYLELLAAQERRWRITAGPDGLPIAVAPEAPTVQELTDHLLRTIDSAADSARRAVAGDPLRAVEYERASTEALSFKVAGYPTAAVPRSVAAWAIDGRSAKDAADDILREAQQYDDALHQLRELRLAAKSQVRARLAAGEERQARQIAEQTIATIQAAVVGIGNARG